MLCGGSRSGSGRCFPVFPKVDAASPRGLMAPPGLRPWAPRVLSGTGCRLPDGLRAPALGSYIVSLRWRGTAPSAPFLMPPLAAKTFTTALSGVGNAIPLWWLAPPPFPRSSVGRQKESVLMGRLGALLRPTWRSYAGPPQGHYGCLAMGPCLYKKA